MTTPSTPTDNDPTDVPGNTEPGEELAEYGGGAIRERHGTLPI